MIHHFQTVEAQLKFAVEKPQERPDFVERTMSTTMRITTNPETVVISGIITRSDIDDWRAVISGEQNREGVSIPERTTCDFMW